MRQKLLTIILLMATMWIPVAGAGNAPPQPGPRDKCPVCGMFVQKYPDFLAYIFFKDGSILYFDGAKDMFKFYFNVGRYKPGKGKADVESFFVTDYYSVTPTDGKGAYYVLDSDVYGPMGKELIPFAKKTEAREFMKDHKGKSLLRFQDVTDAVVRGLDR